ncbi:MAG TPA: cytochrome c [Gemmatimonadaceae bacterium]|nr:cytochrome c [Gemmatimonadaceae bacterium]
MRGRLRTLLILVPFAAGGCEWFTDFKRQPSIWTWEAGKDSLAPSRGNPQMSVPTTGTAMAGYQVSYSPAPGTIDSLAAIPNPAATSAASLVNGRKYYQINCAVCHGDRGAGDGPVTKFGMPGINIVTDMTKGRSDGYIYGMIRNGRGLMPSYNRIEEMDRWDVVNYVRALQGGATSVAVGPLAAPGVTGAMLPGPSQLGPQRPSPFFRPRAAVVPNAPAGALPAGPQVPADAESHGSHYPAGTDTLSAARDSAARRSPR